MKYVFTLGLVSLMLFAGSMAYPSLQWLLIWSALSFGNVALGYAGLGSSIFGKGIDGKIALPLKILNFPYLAYTSLVWHLCRLLSREPAFNMIDDDLVIGRRLLTREVPGGFDHYMDLTAEFEDPPLIRAHPGYQCLPILDASVPSIEELDGAVAKTANGRAFVHCAQGHGRTGLFALALLLRRGKVNSIDQGLLLLKNLRPKVKLNREQIKFVRKYLKNREQ